MTATEKTAYAEYIGKMNDAELYSETVTVFNQDRDLAKKSEMITRLSKLWDTRGKHSQFIKAYNEAVGKR